jgi:iron complex outermembrane recepter protein
MTRTVLALRPLTASATAGVLFVSPIYAQQSVTDPPSRAAEAAATVLSRTNGLEEIVVTAQRREQRLQDVPIAVSAVTAASAQAYGVNSAASLQLSVPSLDFSTQVGAGVPFIRGVGTNSAVVGSESPVATYIDGVYIASLNANIFSFNNIERIEVLKGPQGTLFGRNSSGGVVSIITREPSHITSLDAQIGYGNYNTVEGSLYATTGLGPNAAIDLAVYTRDQRKGFGRNPNTGQDLYRPREISLRSKLLFNLGNTDVHLAADYNDTRRNTSGFVIAPGSIGADGATTNRGLYTPQGNLPEKGTFKQGGVSLRVDHQLGGVKLVSITAYRKVNNYIQLDQEGTPLPIVDVRGTGRDRTFSQEFQILSGSQSPVQWIAGAYYFNQSSAYKPSRLEGLAFSPLPFLAVYGRQRTNSFAGFGQVTAEVIDATKLTLGLRYTVDERHVDGRSETVFGTIPGTAGDNKKSFGKLTWRLALDHKFGTDILGYASFSRGFKSGQFSTLDANSPAVRPETLDAYEVGVKSELFDRRLRANLSAFYYDYSDIQLDRIQNGISIPFNAAKETIKGLDLDIEARPSSNLSVLGGFTILDGKYDSFVSAPLFLPTGVGGNNLVAADLGGTETIRTPKFVASLGAVYTIPTSGRGNFALAANYSYNDGYAWVPGGRLRQPSYNIVNSSISWTAADENLNARLWVRNLLAEKYWAFLTAAAVGDIGTPAPPRTYGISVGYHF